jgi:UPF0755 protein
MRRLLVAFGGLLMVALAFGAGAVIWGAIQFDSPGPSPETRTIIIPRGTGVAAIANTLEEEGLLEHPMVFKLANRFVEGGAALQAGEYEFAARSSPRDIMEKMIRGDTVKRRVTVAEGLTTREILALVQQAEGLEGDIPEELANLSEGQLLPETYFYSWGDSREDIVRRMVTAMDKAIEDAWAKRGEDLPFDTPEEAVVLASIVEKETGVAAERPRVAGVFVNRLKQDMLLQSDPTVIFAITNGDAPLGRPLSRADLEVKSDYNTYVKVGLPPGPIANPGVASLEAAVRPAPTQDLYFVADGSGGHAFAATLAEHNRNVAKLRKLEAQRAAEAEETQSE